MHYDTSSNLADEMAWRTGGFTEYPSAVAELGIDFSFSKQLHNPSTRRTVAIIFIVNYLS